jgi:predicted outer membrane protein
VNPRLSRLVTVGALGVLALAGVASCSSPAASAPPPAAAAPAAPAAGGAADAQNALLTKASQGAAALVALGTLGQEQGAGDQVRTLGGQLATEGKALNDQLQQASGGALADAQPTAEQQALLADLKARTGEPFDQAWLNAASQLQQQARDAANAVLNDPNASPEAKAAAQAALAKLDALAAQIKQAAGSAGAATPGSVNAGTGGQAEESSVPALALGLLAVGAALLGGAMWRRRRSVS